MTVERRAKMSDSSLHQGSIGLGNHFDHRYRLPGDTIRCSSSTGSGSTSCCTSGSSVSSPAAAAFPKKGSRSHACSATMDGGKKIEHPQGRKIFSAGCLSSEGVFLLVCLTASLLLLPLILPPLPPPPALMLLLLPISILVLLMILAFMPVAASSCNATARARDIS